MAKAVRPGIESYNIYMTPKSTNKHQSTISVVILNWNGAGVTYDCLRSLQQQTYKPKEIIVVDNGSTDGSDKYIAQHFKFAKVLKQPTNLGFAGGVNVGIKASTSDYVMLLNNDATCEPNCLQELVQTARANRADITQAVIVTASGKLIDSVGDEYTTWGLPFPGLRNESVDKLPKVDKAIFSASGGASLYKKSIFRSIDYFDEHFFAYYEDVDISMRAQLQGKSIWLSTKAIVHHKMNYTSDKMPGLGREMTIRNSIYIFWKDLPYPLNLKVFPRFLYANWRMTGSAMVKGHPWRAIRAHLVAIKNTKYLLKTRKTIQANSKLSSQEFEALLSKKNPFKAVKKI